MEGNARIRPEDTVNIDRRFQVMEAVDCPNLSRTKGHWYTAVPPLCRCHTGLTLTDFFGRTMVANLPEDVRVGIINVAVGGCKIELFDRDNYQSYVATAPSWMLGMIKEYDGNPYQRLVEMAKLAQKDGLIKGILLHQGHPRSVHRRDQGDEAKALQPPVRSDRQDETNRGIHAGERRDKQEGVAEGGIPEPVGEPTGGRRRSAAGLPRRRGYATSASSSTTCAWSRMPTRSIR